MAIYYPECQINLSAVFDGFGGRDTPYSFTGILPYSVNIHLNSYKEADTWEVVFDARKFPFSPELIRSMGVDIYFYQKQDQTSASNLESFQNPDNILVSGLVDQATLTEDADGGKISLSGRDYTALLIDRQWDPTKSGKGGRVPDGNIQEVVQQLVDEAVLAKEVGRTLEVQLLDYDLEPTLGKIDATVLNKKQVIPKTTHAKSRKSKRGVAVKSDSTYWDVIYKLCLSYGFIVYVKGHQVIICKPHVLQALSLNTFKVAYGRNLEKLEVERKMSKEAVPQIKIRSYDPKTQTVIEGVFPTEAQMGEKKTTQTDKKGKTLFGLTGVGTKKEEFKTYSVPDVKDPKVLAEIARSTYYTLARGEGVVRFSTPHLKDLTTYDSAILQKIATLKSAQALIGTPAQVAAHDATLDMLRMRPGDAVAIEWDAFSRDTITSQSSTQQRITTLLSLGYSEEVAALVADQYDKLDYFRQPFYVKEVNLTWDKDQGAKLDVEAMNFINPERDGNV